MQARSRTVLLSGASRGIGKAISEALLKQNHRVIGITRSSDANTEDESTVENTRSKPLVNYHLDLENLAAIEPFVNRIIRLHPIDALICCAGQGRFGSLEEFSSDQIQQLTTVNLLSHLLLCRHALPTLKRNDRSDIVFIGSENALHGGRYGAVYSASKAGLRAFAQSLQHECSSSNCHIGIVNPGITRTSFFDNLSFEPGDDSANAIDPDTVASCVMQLLNAPDNSVINEINLDPLKKVVNKKKKI